MIKINRIERGMVFFIEEIPGIRKPYVVLTKDDFCSGERSIAAPIITAEYTDQAGMVNFSTTNGKNAVIDLNRITSVNRRNLLAEYFNEAFSRKIANNKDIWDDIDSGICSIFNIAPIVFGSAKSEITPQNSQPIQVIVNVSDYKKEPEKVTEKIFSESKVSESKVSNDVVEKDQDVPESIPIPDPEKRRYAKRMTVEVAKQFLKDYKKKPKEYMYKEYAEYDVDSIRRLYDRVHKAKLLVQRHKKKVSV